MHRVLFEIGPIKLYSYGAMLVIAFLAGLWLARKRAPRYGLTPDNLSDAGFWALILGILGARALFIIQEWPRYAANPSEIYKLQFDGLTSFGGILGGALGLALWAIKAKKPPIAVLDVVGAAFLLAHPLGRIGCFLNGCCYGRTCDQWFCFPQGSAGVHYLPAQIFDGAMNLIALGLLFALERRGVLRSGQSFAVAIGLHGITRFIYEFWRAGSVQEVKDQIASSTYMGNLPVTEAQVAALAITVFAAILFVVFRRRETVDMAQG